MSIFYGLVHNGWSPFSIYGRREFAINEQKICRWRIENWKEGSKPAKEYALFGMQPSGVVIPAPDHFEN